MEEIRKRGEEAHAQRAVRPFVATARMCCILAASDDVSCARSLGQTSAVLLMVFSCSHLLLDKLQRLQAHSQSLYSIAADKTGQHFLLASAFCSRNTFECLCARLCMLVCTCESTHAHFCIGCKWGSEINIQFSSIASPPCFLTQGLSQSLEFTDSARPASQPAPQILPGPLE